MARWAHSDVLDKGPNEIRARANQMRLISAYSAGDSYATVNTNTVATQAMTVNDNAYYEFSSSGNNRVLTIKTNGRSSTASAGSGGTPDLHIAFIESGTSTVLFVTDETSNVVVNASDTVNWPTANITYTSNQPTA